ncbi:Olfactory receptor 7G2 [Sciurus carolinensis]|uniref:Olfactory receptor 7G2 n=1 Tax=Sciurus carolinensis TaxID=30640 RepID=A0AA41TCD9_SCICA|nr:Olfactory receptor 7G2 [Sciurus carolinensis]
MLTWGSRICVSIFFPKANAGRSFYGLPPIFSYRTINNMKFSNETAISEFLLLGQTEDAALQPLIFSLFLCMYLVTVLGNLLIILAVSSDPQLHTPMYFFLCCLSFNDIAYTTCTIPQMLVNIQTENHTITYTVCLTQVSFVIIFALVESFLLVVMSYDSYVAICHPLSVADALLHTLLLQRLTFSLDQGIPHFFCVLAHVIEFSCSDTLIDNITVFVEACLFAGVPLGGIIFSYIHIVSSVLRMPSSGGKHKAFSTYGSHLSVVSLFYGISFGVYISSAVTDSPRNSAVASVMYTVVPQMLNPFIYSLRNKDMNEALRKLFGRIGSLL